MNGGGAAPGMRLPQGWSLVDHRTIDSTNSEAQRLALAGAGTGTVVRAGEQTGGRGRRGRPWVSPAGNLYFSVVVRPEVPLARVAQASFVGALAVAEGIEAAVAPTRVPVRCKWPNDCLCGGRKVAGLLLEGSGTPLWVVIGVGINVASAPKIADLLYPATSLQDEGATAACADSVLVAVCERLAVWLGRWQREGFAPLRTAWLARAAGVGAAVTVRLDTETFSGSFADLDDDGALVVEGAEGTRRRVLAGDVFFSRAPA